MNAGHSDRQIAACTCVAIRLTVCSRVCSGQRCLSELRARSKAHGISWLGGGSEVLIGSVFEVPPPPVVVPASIAPSIAASDSSDTEPEAVTFTRPSTKRTRSSGFDSPLARLFGGGSTKTKKGSKSKVKAAGTIKDKGKARTSSDEKRQEFTSPSTTSLGTITQDPHEVMEVERLKKELADVRESQLRMEEMLNRLLNPAGQDK